MLGKFFKMLRHPRAFLYPNTYSQERYLEFLREHGVKIGKNTRFINPSQTSVDFNRGDYITIGDNCCLSTVTILAHDYSWYTMLDSFGDVLPDPGGRVSIGNNCFIGYRATILKNTEIGDNVIIGAGAVVKGKIPSNTVWAGVPAKQICTLEEYYEKKSRLRISDAVYRREHIKKTYHRNPSVAEMGLFALLFLERTEKNYKTYIENIEFNGVKGQERLKEYFFESTPIFRDFDEFLALSASAEAEK